MGQKKKALKDLFNRVYTGKANLQEKEVADHWYEQLDLKTGPAFSSPHAEEQTRIRMLTNLNRHISGTESSSDTWYLSLWIRGIAAVLVLAMLSIGFYRLYLSPLKAETYTINAENSIKKVTLPDGTVVTLNKLARISWTSDFGKRERKLSLTGEAFFDVKRDSAHRFVLESDNITTTVLGTAFNVECYAIESQIKVSLVRGHVSITDRNNPKNLAELAPGQMMAYHRDRRNMEVKPIAVEDPSAWIKGRLVFNEIALAAALDRLSEHYHVPITYDKQELQDKSVTASLENVTLEEALHSILFMYNLSYQQKKGGIMIR